MEKILRELKLESLFPKFAAQRIEPENVSALSDEELSCLGVSTIGDRLRVRGLCANAEKDHPSVAANVLSERMALFSGRSRSSRRGAKRKAVTKRSWTVSFICVADRYQSRIPSSTDKQVLFHAGLGMKKIKLDLEDDEHDVLEKITCGDKGDDGEIKGFTQLKESGGFEIMYCVSGCKELNPLNCSWTAKDLKANVGSQSKLYLRPIQKNLSTVSILPLNKSQVKEKCIICNKQILMKDLRHHVFTCKTKEGLLRSGSDDDSLSVPAFTSWRIPESSTTVNDGQPAENVNDGESLSMPTISPGRNQESTTSLQDGQAENQPGNSFALGSTISSSNAIAAVPVVDNLSVDEIVDKVVGYCSAENISNPVEILRCLQKHLVTGQPLEVTDATECSRGQTNFIFHLIIKYPGSFILFALTKG